MHPTHPAYTVPFAVDRTDAPRRYDLINLGTEPVDGLTLTHLGSGYSPPIAVRRLAPGRHLSIAVFGAETDDTGVVIVRWRRPDRSEYVWRMSLAPVGPRP